MPSRWFRGYAVLRNRNYRLFWLGQWISLIGTWMQSVTQAWLLVRLGAGPMALGLLGAATSAPTLFLVLAGGVVSDRADRRHVVMVTQALSLVQALVMATITLAGVVQPWHIIALAAVLGGINAFDIPARQSFVVELVGRAEMPNAIALNATGFNVARVAGPAIGGLLVATVGEGICFLINAVSYIAVLVGLFMLDPTKRSGTAISTTPAPGSVQAGIRYARTHATIRPVLMLVGVVSAIAVPYRNFLPEMAQTVLGVGAWRYGLLMAAAGVGAGMGAVVLAGLRIDARRYRRILPLGLLVFAVALGVFAQSRNFPASLALLWATGCGGIFYFNSSNTLVQLSVEDHFRGRVMSLYTLMHQGTATFGSLAMGVLAARFGTPAALLAGALVCVGAGLWFMARGAMVASHETPDRELSQRV